MVFKNGVQKWCVKMVCKSCTLFIIPFLNSICLHFNDHSSMIIKNGDEIFPDSTARGHDGLPR